MTTALLVACLITLATAIATVRAAVSKREDQDRKHVTWRESDNSGAGAIHQCGSHEIREEPTPRCAAIPTSRSETCRSTRRGLAFYRGRYLSHRANMGPRLGAGSMVLKTLERPRSCERVRYLIKRWRAKAYAARLAFERWHTYHYDWRSWLPPVWKRIIACETFSNFRHDSGTYEGAFGFHYDSWDRFRLPGYPKAAYLATPRQQYEVALAIWRAYGFSGWGCAR